MNSATEKMIDFATAIANCLGLEYPDFDDFDATHDFIEENKDEYYEQRRLFG